MTGVSLVLGVASIALILLFPFIIVVTLPMSIAAIALGAISKKNLSEAEQPTGMAMVGIVVGVIALVVTVIITLI